MPIPATIPALIRTPEPYEADQRPQWEGLPCSGPISSGYMAYEPHREAQGWGEHNATDIAAPCGTVIRAAWGGIVHMTFGDGVGGTEEGSLGTFVILRHEVNGFVWFTAYAHLLMEAMVRIGQAVQQGEALGLVGYSGAVNPPGPAGAHLHFAVFTGVGYVNRTLDTFYDPESFVSGSTAFETHAPGAAPGDTVAALTDQELLVMQYTPLGSVDGRKPVLVFPKAVTITQDEVRFAPGGRTPVMIPAGKRASEYHVFRIED